MVDNPSRRPNVEAVAGWVAQTGQRVERTERRFVTVGEDPDIQPKGKFVVPSAKAASVPVVVHRIPVGSDAGADLIPLTARADSSDDAPLDPAGKSVGRDARKDEGGAADIASGADLTVAARGDRRGAHREIGDETNGDSGEAGMKDKTKDAPTAIDEGHEAPDKNREQGEQGNPDAIPLSVFKASLPDQLRSPERVALILEAEEHAPIIYLNETGPTLPSPLEAVREAPDDAIMAWNTTIDPDPSCVYVKNPEELKKLYRAASVMYGYSDGLDTEESDKQTGHESSHAEGVEEDTVYGIKLHKMVANRGEEDSGRISFFPFVYTKYIGPKLGWAALTARPIDLSDRDTQGTHPGDINNLRIMGYKGVKDVAERIIEWNRTHPPDQHFLLPLSYEAARDAQAAEEKK